MKQQKGAALIVVLSLLTVSLMVGLSSMQSSQIDERLAGNYKAASDAQMNAELGASEFMAWLQGAGWPSSKSDESAWDGSGILSNNGDSYLISDENVLWYEGYPAVEVLVKGISGGGAEAYLNLILTREPPSLLDIYGAYTCYGPDCYVETGSGKASNSFNGNDHLVSSSGCSVQGSNEPDPNLNGDDKAGAVIPDGQLVEGGSGDNIVGSPETVNSESEFNDLSYLGDDSLADAEQALDDFISRVKTSGRATFNPGSISGLDNVVHVGVGQTVEISGDSGGLVILEGGTLEFKQGNTCFSGLVVAREGYDGTESQVIVPPTIDGQGTSAIVGAVVGKGMVYSGSGTPSVYYSSMAIDMFAGGSLGDSVAVGLWENY